MAAQLSASPSKSRRVRQLYGAPLSIDRDSTGNSGSGSGATTLSAVQIKAQLQAQLSTPGSTLLSGQWTGRATAATQISATNGVVSKCSDGEQNDCAAFCHDALFCFVAGSWPVAGVCRTSGGSSGGSGNQGMYAVYIAVPVVAFLVLAAAFYVAHVRARKSHVQSTASSSMTDIASAHVEMQQLVRNLCSPCFARAPQLSCIAAEPPGRRG